MQTPLSLFASVVRIACLAVFFSTSLFSQAALPPVPVPLDSLDAFRSPTANWQLAAGLSGDPRHEKTLSAIIGRGILVNQPSDAARGNLFTTREHSDCELEFEFLLPAGSNSGIYLMGRYEVQLFDSWGVKTPTFADCGGIYQRWDESRANEQPGYEGHAPLANASRAPGLWQHLRIEFRGPRFDANGHKTRNARFVKVVLNGFVIHENVEVSGPTRAAAFDDEAPLGPLMIQGDHGPVAFRAISAKFYDRDAPRVRLENLSYRLDTSAPSDENENTTAPPSPEAQSASSLALGDLVKSGAFKVKFTGTIIAPRTGHYLFTTKGRPASRLSIDEQIALAPSKGHNEAIPVFLTEGAHAFQLDYSHNGRGRVEFDLLAEGPGIANHSLINELTDSSIVAPRPASKPRILPIDPVSDRVRIQRGFVPYDPKKQLYAINVGTPAGVHFAYDTETAALLRVWRGGFLDAFEMWEGRGENQYAKPTGPSLTLRKLPVLALLERPTHDWPNDLDPMWTFKGYRLEADGLPVFSFSLSSLDATDRIAPLENGRGLTRTLIVTGKLPSWEPWVLLAEASQITAQPNGHGYIIGDRDYYLDLPNDSDVQPIVRTRNGRQQLVLPLSRSTLGRSITYSLVW